MSALDYNTIVGHDTQTFENILKLFHQYDEDKILWAVYEKSLKPDEIDMMIDDIRVARARMHKENISLHKFSEVFPWEFATINNGCFETTSILLGKFRSNSKACRLVYNKLRAKVYKKGYSGGQKIRPKASYLNDVAYSKMFFKEEYPENVKTLCEEIEGFYHDIFTCSSICKETLTIEKKIKGNPQQCQEILETSIEKITRQIREIGGGAVTIDIKEVTSDEIEQKRAKAKSSLEFATENYHRYSKKQLTEYVIKITIFKGMQNDLQGLEQVLWRKSPQKGKKVRFIINHLEEIVDKLKVFKTDGAHKVPGGFIAWLMDWSEKDGTDTQFYKYLRDTYKGTKYPLPKTNSAFSNQKSKNALNTSSDDVQGVTHEAFLNMINSYFKTDTNNTQQSVAM